MEATVNTSGPRELAQFALDLGRQDRELKPAVLERQVGKAQVAVVPLGMEVKDLKPLLPAEPERKVSARTLYDLKSFVRYVNDQKTAASRVFAAIREAPYKFACVIDFHGAGEGPAGWCQHVVTLELAKSRELAIWEGLNGELVEQARFAEFLKDNRLDVLNPPGNEILSLAMDLELTSESRNATRLPTNEGVRLTYQVETRAQVGTQAVTLPSRITLMLPLFIGAVPQPVECDFKVRSLAGGGLAFGYRMLGVERAVLEAVRATAEKIECDTGVPVWF